MDKIQIKFRNWALLFATICVVGAGLLFTSCEGKEEEDTRVVLQSFGPMPIARGAELKFIGLNLDRVTAVILPENISITSFTKKEARLLTLTVPQEAVPGYVVLKTPDGDITTKTMIGFSEPVSIAGFTPATVKAGDELTITGDYLNLVKEVILTDRITVAEDDFISHSRTEIKLTVPAEAQTGKIAVSNGDEEPIIVYSASTLTVTLPAFTTVTPNPVKAGTNLTIAGTNLDLVLSVRLGGGKVIEAGDFVSHNATQIVLAVPADTKDGKVILVPASGVEVSTETDLVMVVPTLSVTPVTLKNGADITVTGTNLDLIDHVIFGGNKQGTIKAGGTATQILVTVPDDAVDGVVTFVTKADKEVTGPNLTMIVPAFSSFSPTSARANTTITISGTDLDLVTKVIFTGDLEGAIGARTETSLAVTVPVGARTGKITIETKNGTRVVSAIDFTLQANLPTFGSYTEFRGEPGKILTINGTNLLLVKELIFPGNVPATAYGVKTDTRIEVYVPMNVTRGYGTIALLTYEGEQGIFPQIFFGATDPVVDPALMINDFEVGADGHDLGWDNWGGAVELGNDPAIAISGNYMHGVLPALNGWTWIWGCNHSQLPKPSVTKADHYLKMDVNITRPFAPGTGSFTMKLAGTDIDIGHLGIQNSDGSWSTPGWITITFDLATYEALPAVIPSSGDWGMTLWTGVDMDLTGLYVDNIRFEHK
ncbi:MAG TPA: IPT/TIG domain-containing protein [Bacteroidales bacterium]|jgi:RNase P/RNase MRP subunit p29|nr:IPT/TIG domain-containing protein [Bacteroidales bacterium]MDI9533005.1 IPT/TIG domain-containing protein [Bacteroidota bacterium]OPZ57121.1 MAG: IPT/TIG domain protein [Bacteroidetes bacterium ADurb.BinA012]MBP7036476.1 IPT/TIG domain-containing protein [Bacteroidales bacterium]MBP8710039.1 IPT/TIG domain-containing protein [Bacteroidales bacterium]